MITTELQGPGFFMFFQTEEEIVEPKINNIGGMELIHDLRRMKDDRDIFDIILMCADLRLH